MDTLGLLVFLISVAGLPFAQAFDASDLIALAEKTGTIETTVELMPELMRLSAPIFPGTRSAQYADALFPRIILSADGLRVTFNGGIPGHGGHNVMEVIQYNVERRQYDFYELKFVNGKVEVTLNPESCKACHSKYLRPTWPSVLHTPQWAGGFGSTQSVRSEDWVPKREVEMIRKFIAENGDHPRYRALGLQRLAEMSDDRLYAEFTARNDRTEKELAIELPAFFVGHLQRQGLLHKMRVPLLRALENTENGEHLLERAQKFHRMHWDMTFQRERMRDRVLGYVRAELPPEHTLSAESFIPLAALDEVFEEFGQQELWTVLSTAKDSREIELPNAFSRIGVLEGLRSQLMMSAVEDHGLDYLEGDPMTEELLGTIAEADALADCEENLL